MRLFLTTGLVVAIGVCSTLLAAGGGGEGEGEKKDKISLQVAMVLDDEPGLLACTLRNEGDSDYRTTPLHTNANMFKFTRPDGTVYESRMNKLDIKPVIIKSGESITWKINIAKLMSVHDLVSPGQYSLTWKVAEWNAAPVFLLKEKVGSSK